MHAKSQNVASPAPARRGRLKRPVLYLLGIMAGLPILLLAFAFVRQEAVRGQVAREWQAAPAALPGLQSTTTLEVLPIYDANGGANTALGLGVSYLVRTDAATLLLDLGNNPDGAAQLPAVRNLAALGVDWSEIEAVVISHPHFDHVGGAAAMQAGTISFGDYAGDLSSMPIYTPISMTYAGATLTHSSQPTLVASDIGTTGVISYLNAFPISLLDPGGHEQALVINVASKGLVLITGCGHPTLEKLVSRAESLFGLPVVGVVGGLHLQKPEAVQSSLQLLQARQAALVAISPHDSTPQALAAFRAAFPQAYRDVRVGEPIRFP